MLQNCQPRRNFKSFRTCFDVGDISSSRKKPAMAATAANLTTVRLSSGISANILDFGIPQKHVVADMTAMDAGRKAGGVVKSRPIRPAGPEATGRGRKSRRFRQREARE